MQRSRVGVQTRHVRRLTLDPLPVDGVEFLRLTTAGTDALTADVTSSLGVSVDTMLAGCRCRGTAALHGRLTCAVVADRMGHEIRPKETRCR